VNVTVEKSNAIMLQGMEGSTFGVWVSHGEGRAHFTHPKVMQKYAEGGFAPIRYVDDASQVTEEYPFNPNGSPLGIAGLVSHDGRHLCMMPHPERSYLKYQLPWTPKEFESFSVSPWLKLFQNAKVFCENTQ